MKRVPETAFVLLLMFLLLPMMLSEKFFEVDVRSFDCIGKKNC